MMMMMRIGKVLLVVVLLCVWAGSASADTYVYKTSKLDKILLTHKLNYTWGIDLSDIGENETITGASITFNDIQNFKTPINDLWVHLLDDAKDGVVGHLDNNIFETEDDFDGHGEFLNHWEDLGARPEDITYEFLTDDLGALLSYSLDDFIGIGFDPDCCFKSAGVTFSVTTTTSPVPVPASLGLLGLGFVGLVGLSRRRRKK